MAKVKKSERIKEILHRLLGMFESGDLPQAVARTMIRAKAGAERPCDRWSLGNRLLMLIHGTEDARGLKQWNAVGRRVKKGVKAFYILAPRTVKKVEKVVDPRTGEDREEEKQIVVGFRLIPVFRYEDTEGKPLPEPSYDPPEPPPLFDVARKFGVKVEYGPGDGSCYGYFHLRDNRIKLHTHDAKTFFHELGHAVHHTVRPLKGGQHADQEIVAEIVACALCEMYGQRGFVSHCWEYVKSYSSQEPQQALKAVMRVLGDVEEVLKRILEMEAAEPQGERGCAA
ncbi:MAG: M48 family peptidase [Peptococcaceae bacterium]|nr:M48 family peptidase [Peptococcaceae bacterium]